jgi:hypothetical protein
MDYVSAREFALGGLEIAEQGFLVDPTSASSGRYDSEEGIGVLGNGVLWTMDLELDLAHLKLKLYEPGRCTTHPVYWGVLPNNTEKVSPFRQHEPELAARPVGKFLCTLR